MIKVEQTHTPKGRVRYRLHIDEDTFTEKDTKRADRRLWFYVPYPDAII